MVFRDKPSHLKFPIVFTNWHWMNFRNEYGWSRALDDGDDDCDDTDDI